MDAAALAGGRPSRRRRRRGPGSSRRTRSPARSARRSGSPATAGPSIRGLREPARRRRGHPVSRPTSSVSARPSARTRSSRRRRSDRGPALGVVAGPCAVESESQALEIGAAVREAGATLYRGGAFKPRTSPYSFQGLGEEGLKILSRVRAGDRPADRHRGPRHRDGRARRGARGLPPGRRAQHAELLAPEEARRLRKPVLLKRGMSATIEELLLSAEYLSRRATTT
jgi:hypothetical protein